MVMEVEQRSRVTVRGISVILSSKRWADVTLKSGLANGCRLDSASLPFFFAASFTHTQTALQCYSERVSCLNPRTESEKERKAERGRKRRRREQEE